MDYGSGIWMMYKDCLLKEFYDHLNNQQPSILFMMEEEADSKVAFLDVLVEKKAIDTLTSVFRKKTNTGHYLNL